MKRHALKLAVLFGSATLAPSSAFAIDWPQWQGPDRNAVSKETGLLRGVRNLDCPHKLLLLRVHAQ